MKKPFAISLLCFLLVGGAALASDAEDAAIIEVIDRAYVHGVHIEGDPEKMRSGFHESFVMFVLGKDGVSQMTGEEWIARVEAARARPGAARRTDVRADIDVLDRSGSAAVARVKLFHGEKQVFTDYISLYRFEDGWKLVAKTFHRH
jgi:hypothetical protein